MDDSEHVPVLLQSDIGGKRVEFWLDEIVGKTESHSWEGKWRDLFFVCGVDVCFVVKKVFEGAGMKGKGLSYEDTIRASEVRTKNELLPQIPLKSIHTKCYLLSSVGIFGRQNFILLMFPLVH